VKLFGFSNRTLLQSWPEKYFVDNKVRLLHETLANLEEVGLWTSEWPDLWTTDRTQHHSEYLLALLKFCT